MTPGPPSPAAGPVGLVDTSDAILYHYSAEPQAKKLVPIQQFRLRNSGTELTVGVNLESPFRWELSLGEGDLLLEWLVVWVW